MAETAQHSTPAMAAMPARALHGSPPRSRPFESVLFDEGADAPLVADAGQPECFHDLGLDQIVEAVAAPWKDQDLQPFFHRKLPTEDAVRYRQEVMHELERPEVMAAIRGFTGRLRTMRQQLPMATKSYDVHERNRWHLGCVRRYGEAIEILRREMAALPLRSRGLLRWRDYVEGYAGSPAFMLLMAQAGKLLNDLGAVAYEMTIDGPDVAVRRYEGAPDYAAEVEQVFAKFRRAAVKSYLAKLPVSVGLNHIEAQVLDAVAQLNPEVFGELAAFRAAHEQFMDERIERFDREVHFYIGWLDFTAPFKQAGLPFCYPEVSSTRKAVMARDSCDLALARRLQAEQRMVVRNGFSLQGQDRIIVVTGPNQGGKTTFARMFGQLHWLASLGCTVPGTEARLFLFHQLFTHFEREEDIHNLRGKLHDDLVRMHRIFEQATPSSVVVMNEIFSSTTLRDALFLGREIFERLSRLDMLAVCVTFLDELASFDAKVVSLVAAIDPADPTARSFKLERRPADGLAHALAIAEKYRVTEAWLKERIAP